MRVATEAVLFLVPGAWAAMVVTAVLALHLAKIASQVVAAAAVAMAVAAVSPLMEQMETAALAVTVVLAPMALRARLAQRRALTAKMAATVVLVEPVAMAVLQVALEQKLVPMALTVMAALVAMVAPDIHLFRRDNPAVLEALVA